MKNKKKKYIHIYTYIFTMSSSSLLPSKYFDKLQVNRLKANDIKSDNIYPIDPNGPSYLFSAVFNNATFNKNETGGTLTVSKDNTESIIQFSDRPFRQTENIDFDTFVSLFGNSVSTGDNSFEEDPPNGVLIHDEEQRTYIIRLLNNSTDSATFSLELLPGESHNLNTVSGRMNLFVDNNRTEITINTKRRTENPQNETNPLFFTVVPLSNSGTKLTFDVTNNLLNKFNGTIKEALLSLSPSSNQSYKNIYNLIINNSASMKLLSSTEKYGVYSSTDGGSFLFAPLNYFTY